MDKSYDAREIVQNVLDFKSYKAYYLFPDDHTDQGKTQMTYEANIAGQQWNEKSPYAGVVEAKPVLPFDMVSTVYGDISLLVGRIHDLASKLCGSYPTEASGGSENKLPSGIFNELAAHSQSIDQRIRSANEALSRIERMLP